MTWDDGEPTIGRVFTPKLEQLLGPARRRDEPLQPKHEAIAASLQVAFERAEMHVLRHVYEATKNPAPLPGGRLRDEQRRQRQDPRAHAVSRRLHSAGVRRQRHGARRRVRRLARVARPRRALRDGARLLGTEFDDCRDCGGAVRAGRGDSRRRLHASGAGTTRTRSTTGPRRRSPPGRVVGWFQGRMEWGARALGNRSIVADPAARGHARHHQHAHQVSRAVPAVRAVGGRRSHRRLLRRRRARSVHAAGLSDPARQTRRSCRP